MLTVSNTKFTFKKFVDDLDFTEEMQEGKVRIQPTKSCYRTQKYFSKKHQLCANGVSLKFEYNMFTHQIS